MAVNKNYNYFIFLIFNDNWWYTEITGRYMLTECDPLDPCCIITVYIVCNS